MKRGAMNRGKFLPALVVCLLPFSAAHAGSAAGGVGGAVPVPPLPVQGPGVAHPVEERGLRPQPEPPGAPAPMTPR
jgi:hypothetical protein